ncbi:sigma factor [Roseisolibacter agri]|uniref:sigma factor n=1 Tax=Roseisolibacter agri TaxID=2014610 RepID=UPI0024E144FD|nr:sigma factor [Roseisolibacter agri]
MLRFVRDRVRRRRDAEDLAADVAQETLIRLARGAPTCRAQTDPQVLAWALTTAQHVLIDTWRSPEWRLAGARASGPAGASGRAAAGDAEWAALAQSYEESAGRVPDVEPAYALLLRLAVEACDAARDGVATLCWTRLVAGAEWAQVAAACNTSETAVKRRFQRAQAAMRREVWRRVATLGPSDQAAVRAYLFRRGLLPG